MEALDVGIMQDREEGEEEKGVAETDEAEEEGHVKLEGRGTDGAVFEGDGVGAIDDGRQEGEGVTEEELRGGFGGEGVCDGGVVSAGGRRRCVGGGLPRGGEVSVGDEEDAGEGGEDAQEFADGEFLCPRAGADEEGPDGGGGGEDRG